jgi:hypothetical protein
VREKGPIVQHNQRRPNPFICIYCTGSMSAGSTLSNAAESPPIIVFQSRALRIPSSDGNDFGCIRDPQFSTPCKRSLTTDSVRSPTHISKRSRLCVGGGDKPPPSFEFCVQPVNMSFVLSGIAQDCPSCASHFTKLIYFFSRAAADNAENSPPRTAAALARPWANDRLGCVGGACILQVCARLITACVAAYLTAACSCPTMLSIT